MRQSSFTRALSGLTLLMMTAAPAAAQSIRGKLGYQSRATIRIEASVMPRFQVSGAPEVTSLSSNAPSLRYSLLVDSAQSLSSSQAGASGEAATPGTSQPLLMLVVPD